MITCPSCGTEVHADWDWCHACGFDPDRALPASVPPAAVPGVLRSELVPVGEQRPAAPGNAADAVRGQTRPAATGSTGGYTPSPNRTGVIVAVVGVVAVLLVVGVLVLTSRGGDPTPVATADRSQVTITTPSTLAVSAWTLPEGGFKVDLPVALEPGPAPEVPAPFIAGVAYTGTADGRTYLVARLSVHPAYKWEDIGQALVDSVNRFGTQHGFAVISRTGGAFKEMDSSSFTVIDARGPAETEAQYQARLDGDGTGQGIALVTGNQLYLVVVRGTSVGQAQFPQVRDSIIVTTVE